MQLTHISMATDHREGHSQSCGPLSKSQCGPAFREIPPFPIRNKIRATVTIILCLMSLWKTKPLITYLHICNTTCILRDNVEKATSFHPISIFYWKHKGNTLSPQRELRPTRESQGSLTSKLQPARRVHSKVEILELLVAIHYDVIVDNIEEDFLIDALILQVQVKYNTQELSRKVKVVKEVARIRRGEYRAQRITLQTDWLILPSSR